MYKSFKLLTLMVNVSGGESETIEHLYKEVDGKLVPNTKEEAELKFHKQLSTVGGNDKVQRVKCFLIDTDGNYFKVDEIIKPVEVTEE